MRASEYAFRLAKPGEAEAIAKLLLEMAKENWPMVEPDWDKGVASIRQFVENGQVLTVWDRSTGDLVATMGITAQSWWWSQDEFLSDTFIFVKEGHRRFEIILELIRRAKAIAKVAGLPIFISVRSIRESERKNALFHRHFTPAGETFFYKPEK